MFQATTALCNTDSCSLYCQSASDRLADDPF
jgi:hypothetical protein